MRLITILVVCIVAVASAKQDVPLSSRIIGGTLTTIDRWPSQANVMTSMNGFAFQQSCGGVIINNRSILTAAHCVQGNNGWFPPNMVRVRLGSTWADRDGQVYFVQQHIIHPNYNLNTLNSNIMLLRTNLIMYSNVVQRANIASPNYNVRDNQVVWITGWGDIQNNGPRSNQLRQAQVWTINQDVCIQRYRNRPQPITIFPNMLCTGWLDVGGRDACAGDAGGPVYIFNNNNNNYDVIGISSFGGGVCGNPFFPAVNVRVSSFSDWIRVNV